MTKFQAFAWASIAATAMSTAVAENKQYKTTVDAQKKEGTINLDKAGSYKAGLSDTNKLPDAAKSEADRRREQQETSGQVFLRKTF